MGFSVLLDILGSTIVGGLLLMILIRMNATSVQNNYQYSGEQIVQQNLVEVVKLLEYDFRKIGYCYIWSNIPNPAKAILQADSTSITFLTDIVTSTNPNQLGFYGDGVVDTIKYYLSAKSVLSSTPNPNDILLYRKVNHAAVAGSNLGITRFKLTYFNSSGAKIINMPSTPPLGIASVQIDIDVENTAAYDSSYTYDKRAMWRQIRLATRNFLLR